MNNDMKTCLVIGVLVIIAYSVKAQKFISFDSLRENREEISERLNNYVCKKSIKCLKSGGRVINIFLVGTHSDSANCIALSRKNGLFRRFWYPQSFSFVVDGTGSVKLYAENMATYCLEAESLPKYQDALNFFKAKACNFLYTDRPFKFVFGYSEANDSTFCFDIVHRRACE